MTIRTYKGRRGRLSPRQILALTDPQLLRADGPLLNLSELFEGRNVTLDIGFGSGRNAADAAEADPDQGFLAVDVHTPGIADLVLEINARKLRNIRVVHGDALVLLRERLAPDAVHAVRTWFPDPWPKARHHKRRLVTLPNAELMATRCRLGAIWMLATDDPEYAEQMLSVIPATHLWRGGISPRAERPLTHYERRAVQANRQVFDLQYVRIA